MAIRERGKRWQVDLNLSRSGPRFRRDYATQAEALRAEAEAKIAYAEGRPLPGSNADPGLTLGSLRDRVYSLVWSKQKAARKSLSAANLVVQYFGVNRLVSTIDTAAVNNFKIALTEAGNQGPTINRKLAALSKMLGFAAEEGTLTIARPTMRREKEGDHRDRFLLKEEEDRVLATLQVWGLRDEHDLVVFLLDTGARLGEALAVRWIDLTPARVTFYDTKNGEPRSIPLSKRLRTLLKEREAKGDHVFGSKLRRPVSTAWEKVRRVMKLTEDPDFVLHILRHTCASRLLQQGWDLKRVQEWLGHKSITVTQKYAHLAKTSLDEGAKMLDEFNDAKPRHLGVVEGGRTEQAQ